MKKILIVEDEQSISALMKEILEDIGHEVTIKPDGLDGYVEFQIAKYDLILTDLLMPTHGGQLIQLIRNKDKNIPIIVVSAINEKYDKDMVKKRGANGFLSKPFSISDLKKIVDKHLNEE